MSSCHLQDLESNVQKVKPLLLRLECNLSADRNLRLLGVQAIRLPQPPKHVPAYLANFVSLEEMEFLHVSQADLELLTSGDLELLTSGDLPTLASQSAEIVGNFGSLRQADQLRSGVRDTPGQHVEMGFHYVGQAVLELLTSSDPPALAFQKTGACCVTQDDLELLVSSFPSTSAPKVTDSMSLRQDEEAFLSSSSIGRESKILHFSKTGFLKDCEYVPLKIPKRWEFLILLGPKVKAVYGNTQPWLIALLRS
ncbi:hypothetical protein AAY473_002266 [Plecturocebus cupreus]